MLQELLKSVVWRTYTATDGGANGPVVFTSTGVKAIFTAVAPVRILKWGFLVNDTAISQASGSAMALKLTKYPTVGTTSGQSDVDTLTTAASQAFALGTGGYREFFTASTSSTSTKSQVTNAGPIGGTPNTVYSGQAQFTLSVGQGVAMNVTTAADTTGKGIIFLEYVLLPISEPSGYGTTDAGVVSLTENYTQFAS
jgi:hypothetical protein